MANPRLSTLLDGLSGRLGNVVFSERYGRTFIGRRPARGNRVFSADQLSQQEKVRLAGQYIKAVAADPQARAPYDAAARLKNTALAGLISKDFLNSPEVNSIDLSLYTRQPGGKVLVAATDDFEVMSVDVQIRNAAGVEVESGAAVKSGDLAGRWVYTATAQVPSGEAFSVVATATDRPGNKGTKTESVQ